MVPAGVEAGDRLAVLCGPTAVGKTALAVLLAERMAAEIVCADSRTIYRGMDIGTAKPAPELRRRIPHHLLDVADPHEMFTLADYQRLARQAINAVRDRGRLPLIVGGSGLHIGAIVDDLVIPPVSPDSALRRALEAEEREHGPGHLHARLVALDPAAAAHIHPRNVRRIVRALEVTLLTGRPISAQQRRRAPTGPVVMVGLAADRSSLYARIDARVDEQVAAGLVEEVRGLLSQGIPEDAPAMGGLGYKEIAGWLRGTYEYEEAVRRLKRNTRHFAKRQLTWFRRDPRIVWVDVTVGDSMAIVDRVHAIMDAELSPQRRE
ncbi:MAG: tRNA (adenosine(37)-N6)-dimethylallyltransferase MiaA [Armatimonadetes bacterium RBG_16_67_12]|nr:MAG: tRNA (adenosine(37)-N6)-dimethylallyltransferase MiaA [Armatimonadetes bacterium RBG_16_67_12]